MAVRFSIIIPLYNSETYIRQCVESILAQDYDDYEVIIVDDGSTDAGGEIADRLQTEDNRIKVIHKPNGGVVSARKCAAKAVTGNYVITVDSDDYIRKDALSIINKIIEKYEDLDIVCYNYAEFDETQCVNATVYARGLYKGEDLVAIKDELIYSKSIKGLNYGILPFSLWCKAIKKDLYHMCQLAIPDEITKGDDLAVSIPAIMGSTKIFVSDEQLYFYRNNPASMMHTFNVIDIDRYETVYNYLKSTISNRYENQICSYALFSSIGYLVEAVKVSSSYKEFVNYVHRVESLGVYDYIDKASVTNLGWKYSIITVVVKKKIFRLFYWFFKK